MPLLGLQKFNFKLLYNLKILTIKDFSESILIKKTLRTLEILIQIQFMIIVHKSQQLELYVTDFF